MGLWSWLSGEWWVLGELATGGCGEREVASGEGRGTDRQWVTDFVIRRDRFQSECHSLPTHVEGVLVKSGSKLRERERERGGGGGGYV